MQHRLLTKGLALAAGLLLAATTITPATAGQLTPNRARYAALGDSYAAGVGVAPSEAYPVLLAGKANKVTFLAESGATTVAVLTEQVPLVPTTARQITLTVGGNDIGFGVVALACAGDPESVACVAALANAQQALLDLPGDLAELMTAVRTRAPHAQIYVTGYPLLFQPLDQAGFCMPIQQLNPLITPTTLMQADALVDGLNAVIEGVVATVNFQDERVEFVDVIDEFPTGLCGGNLIYPPMPISPTEFAPSSLHPTTLGQQAYAAAIAGAGFVTG
ncbi:MAG TPA: SGNH/GDSL hydrolase family protein [Arachnia sp.]|nr:SGNH/GDSL hydrolase family protein [Arachnia sp.]